MLISAENGMNEMSLDGGRQMEVEDEDNVLLDGDGGNRREGDREFDAAAGGGRAGGRVSESPPPVPPRPVGYPGGPDPPALPLDLPPLLPTPPRRLVRDLPVLPRSPARSVRDGSVVSVSSGGGSSSRRRNRRRRPYPSMASG